MSIKQRIRSIKFAIQGMAELLKNQPNMRVHLITGVAVIAGGFYFRISIGEWLAVVICITLVISMEAINTALEYLTDLVSPEFHPLAGKVKDVAAAAVLVAALGALTVGVIVFGPKLLAL